MKLDLAWVAYTKDGKVLYQFKDSAQHQEALFKEVQELEKSDNLGGFQLTNVKSKTVYYVDLITGRISISKTGALLKNPEIEVSGTIKYKYRLIYFRRVTHEMKWRGENINPGEPTDIQYFLGFQYTNEKGENIKRLLQISKDDEVYIA